MCFDYHGSWEKFTGEHAALYDSKSNISTDYGMRSWIEAGVPSVGPGDVGVLLFHQILTPRLSSTVSYYSYSWSTWVGYDDVGSVKLKIRFAKKMGLSGYFFWALAQDKDWTLSRQASNAWKYGGRSR